MTSLDPLVIGTRGSPLALAQADLVREFLIRGGTDPDRIAIQIIKTTGDIVLDRPLAEIGGKVLFTKELDEALLAGTIGCAVHSMKDVPTTLPDGLALVALLERADPRDILVTLDTPTGLRDLPQGARIGTGALRRRAQLLARRPDLVMMPMRGNVGTRLGKLDAGQADVLVLAQAGIDRLRASDRLDTRPFASTVLEFDEMLPAPAQGAIGIVAREGDTAMRTRLGALDHAPTTAAVAAERAFLAALDGSCKTPIAGHARLVDAPDARTIELRGLVVAPDGSGLVAGRRAGDVQSGIAMGRDLGLELRRRADPAWFADA